MLGAAFRSGGSFGGNNVQKTKLVSGHDNGRCFDRNLELTWKYGGCNDSGERGVENKEVEVWGVQARY